MAQPTPNQTRAVLAQGNVLVMAGAGTGKTRTLVERCLAWLRHPAHPGSLDRLLMVTFTEAAAAEMRRRIRQRLEAESALSPNDLHLREQLALLDTARIQTLHSFCLDLVRQHCLDLDLDPQLRVLDENQSSLLARETFERILAEHLAADTPLADSVRDLLQERGRGWDLPIRELVFRLHAYVRSLSDPAAWLDAQTNSFKTPHPEAWRQALPAGFAQWSAAWQPILRAQPPAGCVPSLAAQLLAQLGPHPSRPQAAAAIRQILEADQRPDWPRGTKTKLRPPIERFFDEAAFWATLLPQTPEADPLQQDWDWVRPQMTALLQLTRDFSDAFTRARRQQATLDFADLEQLALQLLRHRPGPGLPWEPSPTAREWQDRLECIFVDEYQDINEVQDAILQALGRPIPHGNRFLVGDVKQSIYRFRLANPHIFQRYAAEWRDPADPAHSTVIPLSDNFRSHQDILDFINPTFAALLHPEVGGVAYGPEAQLQFGAPESREHLRSAADRATPSRVELHLRLTSPTSAAPAPAAPPAPTPAAFPEPDAPDLLVEREDAELEAQILGLRLLALTQDPHAVWDDTLGQHRAATWSDMVILLRAPRQRAELYARTFARLGIPLAATRGGFLEAIEVTDLTNLLRLLDNPLQDLPLLAVLRSPLVGLQLEDLAHIRLAAPKHPFWTALLRWQETAPPEPPSPARSSVQRFLERYAHWRALSRQGPLSECLEDVLDQTHYPDWCLAQDRGPQRYANVQQLLALTRQFDPLQRQGLFRFLRYLDDRAEAGIDTEPATVAADQAVRLMSVHQSKGLEAPIVAVTDLGRRFNFRDGAADVIFDEQFGLCPRIKPPHIAQRYPSLTHFLASRRQRRETMGEELRLCYVAFTRAAQRLLLVGTAPASAPQRWAQLADAPLPAQRILAAGHWLDWLGPLLPHATGSPAWFAQPAGSGPLLAWTLYPQDDPRLHPPRDLRPEPLAALAAPLSPQDLAQLETLSLRLRWRYPHLAATTQPAKTSASALRPHLVRDHPEASPAPYLHTREFVPRRPAQGLSAAEIGLAHHTFLQYVDLQRTSTPGELGAERDRLRQTGHLTDAEAAALDLEAILAFWQSEIGLRLRTQAPWVERELPFTLRLHYADLVALHLASGPPPLDDEFVIVQGVVDLAVLRERDLWLLDFKTDRLSPRELPDRIALHTPQVQLYALALERIFHRPVTHRWLHFLALNHTAALPG